MKKLPNWSLFSGTVTFDNCDGNIVKLWNTLSNEGYPELCRISLGILVIAPENASCEQAFSIMKFIKNNQRSCLSQLHLDNAQCIGLETHKLSDFPFEQLFHYIKN